MLHKFSQLPFKRKRPTDAPAPDDEAVPSVVTLVQKLPGTSLTLLLLTIRTVDFKRTALDQTLQGGVKESGTDVFAVPRSAS